MTKTIKCKMIISFEYFNIIEADANIDAMLDDILDLMEDQGCDEMTADVYKMVELGEKVG